MPSIDKIQIKLKTKKFTKVPYRPWDLEENSGSCDLMKPKEDQKIDHSSLNGATYGNNQDERTFRQLYGIQKNILIFLCNKISHEDDNHSYSFAISVSELVDYTRSNKGSIFSSLTRLKQKKLLLTFENKTGKGGFASYKINKALCQYIRLQSNILSI